VVRSPDKHNPSLKGLAALYREYPFVVEFWNPGFGQTVHRGFPTWTSAMKRAAHYTRKYGQFDGFEKPRIKATGAPLSAFRRAVMFEAALANKPRYACSRCGRKSYERGSGWTPTCDLPQPDGSRCTGWMVRDA
jgi:ribosomal protein L37E